MSIEKINNPGGVYESGGEPDLTAKKPGKVGSFMGGLGKVASVAAGVMFPGVGPIVGGILGGKSLGVPGLNMSGGMLGSDSSQYLQYQMQMTMEMRSFELASTILKNRHDASMSAIRNMKG